MKKKYSIVDFCLFGLLCDPRLCKAQEKNFDYCLLSHEQYKKYKEFCEYVELMDNGWFMPKGRKY